jgi:hypothetical protein
VYLRPWTLIYEQSTAHVPHLKNLDAVISDVLQKRRLRGKQAQPIITPIRHSFALAWDDYRCRYVVSVHAARLIKSFLLAQMDTSAEVDKDEEEEEKAKEPKVVVSTAWASLDKIKELLHQRSANDMTKDGKRRRNAAAVHASKDLTRDIWYCPMNMDEEAEVVVCKEGSMHSTKEALPAQSGKNISKDNHRARSPPKLYYRGKEKDHGLTKKSAEKWFQWLALKGLDSDTRRPRPKPNTEQQLCIRRVVDRCLKECLEESNDVDFRSEPEKLCIHGVPGAGKSEVLYWLRDFFENVCCWEHGEEFAYLAFQHSMVALIKGFTFDSFCATTWITDKGAVVNQRREQSKDMSKLFVKYQRLRWIFIDECSTLGVEKLSLGETNVRTNIRERGTWARRKLQNDQDFELRSWGGVNLCLSGDFWQFTPIQDTAIFADPFATYHEFDNNCAWTPNRVIQIFCF